MWQQWYVHGPRSATDCQPSPEAKQKAQNRFSLEPSERTGPCLTSDSGLPNHKGINVSCLKLLDCNNLLQQPWETISMFEEQQNGQRGWRRKGVTLGRTSPGAGHVGLGATVRTLTPNEKGNRGKVWGQGVLRPGRWPDSEHLCFSSKLPRE